MQLGDIHIDLWLLSIALVLAGKLVCVDLVRQLLSRALQSESLHMPVHALPGVLTLLFFCSAKSAIFGDVRRRRLL